MDAHSAVHERSSPFAIPTKKLAMWLFIIADAATFAACLLAYGFLRNGSQNWPTPFKFYPTVVNAMVMTFILVTSSLTMFMGVRAAKQGDRGRSISLDYDHRGWRRDLCHPALARVDGHDR